MQHKATAIESQNLYDLSLALIFALALLLRLAPGGRYVTPDEPAWVQRSIHFRQALAAGDLSALPATGHPGVTTMWLGSLGVQIHCWLDPDTAAAHLNWLDGLAGLSPQNAAAFGPLAFFLPAGRVLVAVVTSLGVAGAFALSARLWGRKTAWLAALLLALDPFLIGHSGLLHVDGLLATATTLSILTLLLTVRPAQPAPYRWAALSGLLAGLAALTKTPGGLLAPFAGIMLLSAALTRRLTWHQALIALTLWGVTAGLAFLAFYPAMWTAPLSTLRGLLDVGERHVEGALRPIFFHGQDTFTPGAGFYPVVGLLRASPWVLLGWLAGLWRHLRRRSPRRHASGREGKRGQVRTSEDKWALALTGWALGFGLCLTLVGKKHDRYLLPVFPALTLVAALGWQGISEWLGDRGKRLYRFSSALVALFQIGILLPYLFTPLAFFNPLLGGPRTALEWLPVGWGEGSGAAARWLNEQPNAEQLIVASPSIPPLASLFVGQTVPLSTATLSQADYFLHPPQQGTHWPQGEGDATLVYEKRIAGIIYARLYRNPAPLAQAAYLSEHAAREDVVLLDTQAALTRTYNGPATLVSLADARNAAQVAERLHALQTESGHIWYVALSAASPVTMQHLQQALACYGELHEVAFIAGATFYQIIPEASTDPSNCIARLTPSKARFGERLSLVGTVLPSVPLSWPDDLPVVVRWSALAPLSGDYRAVLHLRDATGRTWLEGGQEILDADYRHPSAWRPNEWSDQTFKLSLPPAIPPGQYRVALGAFDPDSGKGLSAWDTVGRFAGLSLDLGHVTIAAPERPPTPGEVDMTQRIDPPRAAGPLRLLGQHPPPAQVPSGDVVSFDLFWQATTAPDTDYALRWQLLVPDAPAGSPIVGQTLPLSPYATGQWRDGELEQVRYDLPIPPDLPAGLYDLRLNVLDADGTPLWADNYVLTRLTVLARDRLFSLPAGIAYPLDLRLGQQVQLRGFDLPNAALKHPGALEVKGGQQIPLTLYWQANGPTDLSYIVFVHLRGPGTRDTIYGQVDRPPANGAAPTHSWAPGQVIIDELALPVLDDAPPGAYHVAVGLYDPLSGARLPVYDAAGNILPNDQILLPIEVNIP